MLTTPPPPTVIPPGGRGAWGVGGACLLSPLPHFGVARLGSGHAARVPLCEARGVGVGKCFSPASQVAWRGGPSVPQEPGASFPPSVSPSKRGGWARAGVGVGRPQQERSGDSAPDWDRGEPRAPLLPLLFGRGLSSDGENGKENGDLGVLEKVYSEEGRNRAEARRRRGAERFGFVF